VRADRTVSADKDPDGDTANDGDGDMANGENGEDDSSIAESAGDALPLLSSPDRLAGPVLEDRAATVEENAGPAPAAHGDAAPEEDDRPEEDDAPDASPPVEADAGNDAALDAASAVEPDAMPAAEVAEARAPAAPVETVGGDEAEEVRRRRSRPQRRYKI